MYLSTTNENDDRSTSDNKKEKVTIDIIPNAMCPLLSEECFISMLADRFNFLRPTSTGEPFLSDVLERRERLQKTIARNTSNDSNPGTSESNTSCPKTAEKKTAREPIMELGKVYSNKSKPKIEIMSRPETGLREL